jgi:hypothetical protein
MPYTPAVLKARATVAAQKRHHPEGGEAVDNAVRDLNEVKLRQHIEKVVSQAPPLSDEQRSRLAALLQGGGSNAAA